MKYRIGDISKNKDIKKILEILASDLEKEALIEQLNSVVKMAPPNDLMAEINIYMGDYSSGVIDKKRLIEEIMRITHEENKKEA